MKRGNGDGSIFKLSGKRKKPFAVRITIGFTIDGKQKYSYLGYYKTKTEAKKALNEYLTKPFNLEHKDFTFMTVFDEWSKNHKLSDETFKAYKAVFNRCTKLHKKKFRDIKLSDFENFTKTLTPAMQKVFRNVLKNLYKYALKHEITEKNLSELLDIDKITPKNDKNVFKNSDIKKLEANVKNDFADIPVILLYTGMRINELLTIESKNVNIEERYIIGGLKTENGKNRKIPIHKKIIPLIEKRLQDNHKYLISSKNKPINYNSYSRYEWKDTVNSFLKKKHTPHETRHTFVTQAVNCGIDKILIQKIVGHSAKDVTDHYTHIQFNQLLEAIDKFTY